MKSSISSMVLAAVGLCALLAPPSSAESPVMKVDSFAGPVTQNEIDSFKSYVQTLTPAGDNIGNNWAQGHSGEQTKAMGVVYEISHDTAILDTMIGFCDAVLSERNDLASDPVGQRVLWTGGIDPAWPNTTDANPATGGEQGDPVGHLGNCARLILQTPSIWNNPVSFGDPDGFGTTYLDRAKAFMYGADAAVDGHILARLLDVSQDNRQYFAADSPYQGGKPVPWNQQMMFNYGFQNLAVAHEIVGDDPDRVATYDGLVQTSVNWFFSVVKRYKDKAGKPAYDWGYAPSRNSGEDSNHGSLDVAGFYRAYLSGRYKISATKMRPFANMFVDVMSRGPKDYAGRVNGTDGTGHGAPTKYIRSGYLLLAEFRPDAYRKMMGADLTEGGTTGSIDQFARFLLIKSRRAG